MKIGIDILGVDEPSRIINFVNSYKDDEVELYVYGLEENLNQITKRANELIYIGELDKDYYEKNYTEYVAKLDAMIKKYEEQFAKAPHKNFVTGHAAFAYLCRDFGLEQNSVEDVFAEGEPNAAQLAKLIEYAKENHITTIFAEEMASPEVSKTLAQEVGAKVETIYTIESKEDDKTYLQRMDENLTKIAASLQ